MCALRDLSDDALEIIAHFLGTPEKCMLLATGDSILSRRLIKSTSRHTVRLGDRSIYRWNHLRRLKMPFGRLTQNPFCIYPSSWSSSPSSYTSDQSHIEFQNLIRLKIHIVGARWMQALGSEEIAKIFPQLQALHFYCRSIMVDAKRIESALSNGENRDFSFLSGLNVLKELTFDQNTQMFPYIFPKLLPPLLDTLHVPQLGRLHRTLFDFTHSVALTTLYIDDLNKCLVFPPNLTSLRISSLKEDDIEEKFKDLPPSLTSIVIDGGFFDPSILCSLLPASVVNISTERVFNYATSLLDLLPKGELAVKMRYIAVIADVDANNLSIIDLASGLPGAIGRLTIFESNRPQVMALISNINIFNNLVELVVKVSPTDEVSFLTLRQAQVNEQSIASIPDFVFPPSLRRLTISVFISDFIQHTCYSTSGDTCSAARNHLGNIFMYRSFGTRTCPLSRCKLDELKILVYPGFQCEDMYNDMVGNGQAVSAIFDAIPSGLKSLSLKFVEDACSITNESPVFTNGAFKNLMNRVNTTKHLSFSGIQWNDHSWFRMFPRTLKHLEITIQEFNGFANLNIDDFPPFLKTLKYSAHGSGSNKKMEMPSQFLQLMMLYYKETGRKAFPRLEKLDDIMISYSTFHDDPTFDYSSLSNIENVNVVNRY